jgi:hypothetical protein
MYNYYREIKNGLEKRWKKQKKQKQTNETSLYFLLRRSEDTDRPCPSGLHAPPIFHPQLSFRVFLICLVLIASEQGPTAVPL